MSDNKTPLNVYIVDGARTPFLKAKGKPGPFAASDLAVQAGRQLLSRQSFLPSDLDEVVIGCMMPSENEANIGRLIALRLGCGDSVPGWTVQRNCASGMQALDSAIKDIAIGRHDLVLAGGTEAMSRAPLIYNRHTVNWFAKQMRAKTTMQKLGLMCRMPLGQFMSPIIALKCGLTDPILNIGMGQTAEEVAFEFGITREQMDQFALDSHLKAASGFDEGHLTEITPLYANNGKCFLEDDGVRRDSTLERLGKLRPMFDRKFGRVTAGNSSQVTDGASLLLLANENAVEKHGLKPIAKIVDVEWAALDPRVMGLGPTFASIPLMQRNNLSIEDIDYWEINEAFAGQVLGCVEAMKSDAFCKKHFGLEKAVGQIPMDRLNVDGGAVAVGHPVGASGARITHHLTKVLEQNNKHRGIASICIGGGQGGAMLIERV